MTVLEAYMRVPKNYSYARTVDRISQLTGLTKKQVDREVDKVINAELRQLGMKL